MDILEIVRDYIAQLTDTKTEIEPSNSDYSGTRLIIKPTGPFDVEPVSVRGTKAEIEGVLGDASDLDGVPEIYANQKEVYEYLIGLPIRMTLYSEGTSVIWRRDILSKDLAISIQFVDAQKVPAMPTINNQTALARIQAILPNFENVFFVNSKMQFTLGLKKNENEFIIFEREETGERQDPYVYEVNWDGYIVYKTGGLKNVS